MKKKILLLYILIALLCPLNVFASTNTVDRNTLDNLGVNKKWQITDNNRVNILNSKKVDATEKIYDFSDILTEEEEKKLYDKIEEFTKKTKMEFIFLSDDIEYSYDEKNEQYATDFYDYNDFGLNLDKYSGIILFRNTYAEDPYYDMYLFGNSQLYFDTNRKDESLDGIYSDMKSSNYYEAISNFINYCYQYYNKGVPEDLQGYYVDDMGYLKKDPNYVKPYKAPILSILLLDSIIVFITIIILINKNKMVKTKLNTVDYIDKTSINITKQNDIFVRSYVTSHTNVSNSSSGGGSSYHSSSGSSGGGHSSGGGRHG